MTRQGDEGGDLLIWPEGDLLESHWIQGVWETRLNGERLALSPWKALEAHLHRGPWFGAASFELSASEAQLAFQAPRNGSLGMRWRAARLALSVSKAKTELWSWNPEPPDIEAIVSQLASACALQRARGTLDPLWNEHQHREAIERIQTLIRDGAFYVANLCVPFLGSFSGDPVTLALSSFQKAKPPYGAWIDLGDSHLICLSMERLLARRGDHLWTEPIKGSEAFSHDDSRLQQDPKERAEHSMIVDLERNDLGRVSCAGSVEVRRFLELERYPTVNHLVSRIESEAKPGLGLAELLRAMLPGGSVTGTPKRAVCEHLAKTEVAPRGFYCGALGWIDTNGDLDLALPIRTAHVQANHIIYWSGGGITLRSDADKEWKELFLKTETMRQALHV
jgi:anthranilate/para-aminobenzoate synthase component I